MIATLAQAPEDLLRADEDLDVALSRVVKAGGSGALPVVDGRGALVGALAAGELMVELEQAATEDVARYAATGAAESYFGTALWDLVFSRGIWLIALLVLQSASSVVLGRFSSLLERHLALALFLTMLTGTAAASKSLHLCEAKRVLAAMDSSRRHRGQRREPDVRPRDPRPRDGRDPRGPRLETGVATRGGGRDAARAGVGAGVLRARGREPPRGNTLPLRAVSFSFGLPLFLSFIKGRRSSSVRSPLGKSTSRPAASPRSAPKTHASRKHPRRFGFAPR